MTVLDPLTGMLDWVERMVDYAYAAGAAGEFSLEAGSYRSGYAQLYQLYEGVRDLRASIESRAVAMVPTSVTSAIPGVLLGANRARDAVGNPASNLALVTRLRRIEAELSGLLTGMHAAYRSSAATDAQAAAQIAKVSG